MKKCTSVALGVLLLFSCLITMGCSKKLAFDHPARLAYIKPLEEYHGFDTWMNQKAFQAEFHSDVHETMSGTITFTTNMSHCRMDVNDGSCIVWDGEKCWVSPPNVDYEEPRFKILTYVYFYLQPFKFSDQGSFIELLDQERIIHGRPCDVARMTFSPDLGPAPEDWYLIFKDQKTQRLLTTAYINTYGSGLNEIAQITGSSCTYEDIRPMPSHPEVKIAHICRLRKWSNALGPALISHGRLTLENPRFVNDLPADFFSRPENSREDVIPESQEEEEFNMEEFIQWRKHIFGLKENEEYLF